MPLSSEDLRFACDDVRTRHAAVVDPIHAIDRQALGLLQLYITLSGGALSASVLVFYSSHPSDLPRVLGFGTAGFAVMTVLGATSCLRAMWSARINLPGREPTFWLWADGAAETPAEAYRGYLEDMVDPAARNTCLNARMARNFRVAKILGVSAPVVGALAAAMAYAAGL